jgi:hypothetical protein
VHSMQNGKKGSKRIMCRPHASYCGFSYEKQFARAYNTPCGCLIYSNVRENFLWVVFFKSIGQSSESVDKFTVNEVPTRGVV